MSGVFLAKGETFEEVVEKDLRLLKKLREDITPTDIANRLELILRKYVEERIIYFDDVEVEKEIIKTMKKIPPPLNVSGMKKRKYDIEQIKNWRPAIIELELDGQIVKYLIISQGTMGAQHCHFPVDNDEEEKVEKGCISIKSILKRQLGYNCCAKSDWGSTDYVIYNFNNKSVLSFGGLLIHLLKEHNFFEGNVMYRCEPETALKVLNYL